MRYPCVLCNRRKILENLNYISSLMHKEKKNMTAVVKGVSADKEILKIIEESDCDWIASSRIGDLKDIKTSKKKMLIRLSQPCEIEDVILGSEVSFESEISTIMLLEQAAKKLDYCHGVIVSIDLGDLREGIFYKDTYSIYKTIEKILSSNNLSFYGIGTNLGCFGGVKTDVNNMNELISLSERIKKHFNIPIPYISGMTSSAFDMIENESMPIEINHGRFGEAWLLGNNPSTNQHILGLHDDAFLLKAQIVEIYVKPSKPIGTIAGNAFGEKIERDDYGEMNRGILAFGIQDVDYHDLVPCDSRITFVGGSSDYTIVNLNCASDYKVGDVLSFRLSYHSLLSLFTSKYVNKLFT